MVGREYRKEKESKGKGRRRERGENECIISIYEGKGNTGPGGGRKGASGPAPIIQLKTEFHNI